MAWRWIAQHFPRRVTPPADAALARMARTPSYRAPHPRELLAPAPASSPLPAMSTDERALLDAVLADPDADEPRLRYADWCDRRGDARGAFIRTQIQQELDRITGSTGLNSDPVSSCDPVHFLTPFAAWSPRDVVFRRGFAEAMSLSGRAFVSLGAALVRLTPLRDLRLVAVQPYMAELAACEHLSKLRRLDLSGNRIGVEGARALAASPHLTGLREMVLRGNDVEEITAELRKSFACAVLL